MLLFSILWAAAWVVVTAISLLLVGLLVLVGYAFKVWLEERKTKAKRPSTLFVEKGKVRKVAVIGAGPSGIAAAKEAMVAGMEVTVFEQTGDIGGTWVFREKEGQSSVYRSTFINTSKQFMCFSDYPMAESLPTFPHHKQIIKYFRDYAKHFNVLPRVRFYTQVVEVEKKGPTEWLVRSRDSPDGKPLYQQTSEEKQKGKIVEETYDAVFVCSGHHNLVHVNYLQCQLTTIFGYRLVTFTPQTTPRMPALPGQAEFQGRIIHSHSYKDDKNPVDCHEKRVVVVGIGNSGVDVANELSRCARQVYLSVRTGAWVIPKFIAGRPMDHVLSPNRFLQWLVPQSLMASYPLISKLLIESAVKKAQGDMKDYLGVEPPPLLSAHPTVSHELLHRIGTGTIVAKAGITGFSATEAIFSDGSRVKADVVVFCTGYHISFPFLPENVLKVDDNKVSLYKWVFNPDLPPTLAQIGLIQPLGAIMPISELQARWAVQVWLGATGLPSLEEMKADIHAKKDALSKRYLDRPRHTIQVDWPAYPDEIATEIGCKPDLFANYKLLAPLLFSPVLPPQYRLNGPGRWEGAAAEVQKLWDQVKNHRPTMEAGAGWDDSE